MSLFSTFTQFLQLIFVLFTNDHYREAGMSKPRFRGRAWISPGNGPSVNERQVGMSRNKFGFMVTGALTLSVIMVVAAMAAVSVDPDFPEFTKNGEVEGSLKSIGSDTMNNEMALSVPQ